MNNNVKPGDTCLVVHWEAPENTIARFLRSLMNEIVLVLDVFHQEAGTFAELDVPLPFADMPSRSVLICKAYGVKNYSIPTAWLVPIKDPGDEEVTDEEQSKSVDEALAEVFDAT